MMPEDPFPPLKFVEFCWEGQDILPAWAGTQSRRGPYTSVDRTGPADGGVTLYVSPPGGEEAKRPPDPAQATAYSRVKQNDAAIAAAVLQAVLTYTRGLDAFYKVPEGLDMERLRGIVGLGNVHVLDVVKDGEAYVGFELGCQWDEDHGCGVMTHRGRIVMVGQADEAFEGSIAEQDGGIDLE